MNLSELNILYKKVSKFMQYTEGQILGLYMIYKNDFVQFIVEIKYSNKEEYKICLLGLDIENETILNLTKEEYVNILDIIYKLNKKTQYLTIKDGLINLSETKNIIECDKYFIITGDTSTQPKYNAKSYIFFNEIDYKIDTNVSVLYCSPNIATSYAEIEIDNMDKSKLESINYLTEIDVNIVYKDIIYNDFGHLRNMKKTNRILELLIEPIQATLLDTLMLDEIYFNQITPEDMMKVMSNITNAFEVGNKSKDKRICKKYKYISTLNNFELKDDVVQIGDVIFSKNIEDINIEKIKPNSRKYIYISTYVSAETIADAQKIAIQKIEKTLSIMQLIEKNGYLYKLYNEKEEINEWDIRKIFIDYKMGERFCIFNIFETEQNIYGSNRELIIKNYGSLNDTSDLILYNNEINELIVNNTKEEDSLPNAIYWLNKGIEEINVDISKCILYLNIALEYCAKGETGESFFSQNEGSKEIFEDIGKFLEENYHNNKVATEIKNKLNEKLSNISVPSKFENMLNRLNINYTDRQFKIYKDIRKARNEIIHDGKKTKEVEIQKDDIIECYMLLSKVMFYKLKENLE